MEEMGDSIKVTFFSSSAGRSVLGQRLRKKTENRRDDEKPAENRHGA